MAEASTLQCLPRRLKRTRGFTYLSMIILVAIIGLVAASAIKLGSVLQRSRMEQELLDIGAQFSEALKSYADATPQGQPPQPPSLKELLKDPRFPGTRRHLRKIFVDPMTGKAEWGMVYLGDKIGVLAVYSLSDAKPVKIGNFPAQYSGFEGKNRISDWKFNRDAASSSAENQVKNTQDVPFSQQNRTAAPQTSGQATSVLPTVPPAPTKAAPETPVEAVSPSEQPPASDSPEPPAPPVSE